MRLTEISYGSAQPIEGYGPGFFRIGSHVLRGAALIMVSVFLGFVTGADPSVKMLGLGLATAIFVDATIVRMVLVPAAMALMGDANWWLPRPLERVLPNVHVEGLAPVEA